jgi:hypothetical protein
MQTLSLLSGLVKDGVIESLPPAETKPPETRPTFSAPPSAPPEPEPPAPAREWPQTQAAEQVPTPDWTTSAEPTAPQPEVRQDLQTEIAQRIGTFEAVPEAPASPVDVPPAIDDRLSSLSGLFAPGPAANAQAQHGPGPQTQEPQPKETDWWRAPGAGAPSGGAPAESWMTPPPASKEAPANSWAPTAKPEETAPWGTASSRADEWAPPHDPTAADAAAEKDKKKSGGFLSRFRREESPTSIAHIEPVSPAASKTGKLASLSNALLMEYNSGGYGKGKIETRLANLLMRVDEQADPIDRPLPVVDDLIDAAALEREGFDEQQAVPYLATLVRQIYEDAEHAFGKDKAKKGYKAAQQQVFGGNADALQSPELAGKLPKV